MKYPGVNHYSITQTGLFMDSETLIFKALVLAFNMIIRALSYLVKVLVDLITWLITQVNGGGSTLRWPRIGGRP